MQIVRVKNVGPSTFKSKFDSESYTVAPGSESLVPYAAMILWAGNPDARNIDARQRNRTLEVNRIRVKYGAYEDDAKMAANAPSLEFYTMEGERIWTVLDDPEGEHTNPNFNDEQSNATMTAQLSDVKTQLDKVLGMISSGKLVLADGTESTNPEDVVTTIAPTAPAVMVGRTKPVDAPPLAAAEPAPEPEAEATNADTASPDGPPVDSPKTVKVGGKA